MDEQAQAEGVLREGFEDHFRDTSQAEQDRFAIEGHRALRNGIHSATDRAFDSFFLVSFLTYVHALLARTSHAQ